MKDHICLQPPSEKVVSCTRLKGATVGYESRLWVYKYNASASSIYRKQKPPPKIEFGKSAP